MSNQDTNLADLLEVIYRSGGKEFGRGVLLPQARMHFDHLGDDGFWNLAEEAIKLGLIEQMGPMHARLTLKARRQLEQSLDGKSHSTHNHVSIGTNINSPIQQAGALANQSQVTEYSSEQIEDLRKFTETLRTHIGELNLPPEAERKAAAQIATIDAQLQDDPDPVIVRQAGRTLRNVTEGAIGSLIATAAQPTVWPWIQAILSSF